MRLASAVGVLGVLGVPLTSAAAQEALLPRASWGLAPSANMVTLSTPLQTGSGLVKDVMQVAVPLRLRGTLGSRWAVEAGGSAVSSRVTLAPEGGTERTLSLSGLTDVRLRLTGPLIADRLVLTVGANLPVGTTGLDAEQTTVLQTIGAPALRLPVAAMGLGPGATVGLVAARQAGPWALAFGASAEERTQYTPVELAIVGGGTAATKIDPGMAAHVTLGADRAVGDNRLSLLVVGDLFTEDAVTVGTGAGATASNYTLGPQVSVLGQVEFAARGWRESQLVAALRHRSAFSDGGGRSVTGSDGQYLEAGWSGVRGGATGRGLILGVDARWHSGLAFTEALVGAAVTAAGATVGVELPAGGATLRLAVRGQAGQMDTGTTKATMTGFSIVGALSARREGR